MDLILKRYFSRAFKPLRRYRYILLLIVVLLVAGVVVLVVTRPTDSLVTHQVKSEVIQVESINQVEWIQSPLVKPLLYTHLSGLDKLPVRKAKAKFIAAVLPSVLVAKHEVEQRRKKILWLRDHPVWTDQDSAFYLDMKGRYRAHDINDLLVRTATLPTSLILAQAAVESGWGKSRIFLAGNNLFGVWSYNAKDPRIPALKPRKNKRTYLRSYLDMSQSIVHYFEIIARSRSYRSLREARQQTENPFELLPHLSHFSERRTIYTNELKKIIINNNLTQFDTYQIDPLYLVEN
ncbi:glucosaminidase domain-containing protein [Chryseolinea lacunae]|uniref:Glucosaminidase domain-containing protein n=1 Tax=Chryseolinea lacunae TaxID=2801331 RepID=A0ABS1L356_9BACT|nr:glucosaminidase domain-containing protein [Chryseolinea lacunae]MBL0745873.1 glucosaminidase domain-containing protein [Chryseolinea lacunae]